VAKKAISLILKTSGYVVHEAGTVADGIRALAQRPQWILLDLMLPDGSGLDVLRAARAAGVDSKVCIITGCSSEMLAEARVAGAEHTFTKPLNPAHLMALLAG
jgi:DNA-binding response OmpR family regulator